MFDKDYEDSLEINDKATITLFDQQPTQKNQMKMRNEIKILNEIHFNFTVVVFVY